jgi:predicted aspartyl protease
MTRPVFDRRQFATMAGAAIVLPAPASAAVIDMVGSSRLTPLSQQPYEPPTSLSTVADIYRRMTVPVAIQGQGPFPFVVDTGANQSVISDEIVASLGLARGAEEPLHGVAGVQMAATTVATLDIGGRIQKDVVLSILPGGSLGGDGMLGLDRLDGQELTLDFQGRSLRIKSASRLFRDPTEVAVKANRRDGQLTLVDADIAGIRLLAFLDSGAQNTIGNMALRELAITRNPTTRWTSAPVVSATGQTMMAEIADLPRLRIGGMRLPNWPVAFADLHTFRMWNMIEKPAILLGVDVLSRFQTVCLDFSRNEVRFRLPS